MKISSSVVLAIGGPPHSGKSVFVAELFRQLRAIREKDVFLQRACPDGEGMWADEAEPKIVSKIRKKWKFTDEFVQSTVDSILNLRKRYPLLLLDLGGMRKDADNGIFLNLSTDAILLIGDQCSGEKQPWIDFVAQHQAQIIAILDSQLVRSTDGVLRTDVRSSVDFGSTPLAGKMLNLHRGEADDTAKSKERWRQCYREAIKQLAEWLWDEVARR